MKKLGMFTLFVFGSFLTFGVVWATPSKAEKNLRNRILQLESYFTPGATSSKWKTRRIKWLQEVYRASHPREFGKCVEVLEDYIRWEGVDKPKWKPRRKIWARECSEAKSLSIVASHLLELETHMNWSAFSPIFKTKRTGWRNSLKNIGNLTTSSGTTTQPNNSSRNNNSPEKIMTILDHFAANRKRLVAHPHTGKLFIDLKFGYYATIFKNLWTDLPPTPPHFGAIFLFSLPKIAFF